MKVALIHFAKDNTVSVANFATKREAQANGNDGYIITAEKDLLDNLGMTIGMMRDVYNSLSEEKVTRFSDRESAARRLFKALGLENAEPQVSEKMAKEPKASKAKGETQPKAKKPATERKAQPQLTLKATAKNTYRVGTQSFETFELVKANPNKSLNELVKLGGRANTIREMIREELFLKG